MKPTLLRDRDPDQPARVTNVELFFDLVFVFAVTQLSHSLLAHQTPTGALHAIFLMLAVWWVWVYTAWVTNWLDPEHWGVRGLIFTLMGLGLVISTSVPDAFDERAVPFAFAYVTFQVGRSLFMIWAGRHDEVIRRNFIRIATWLVVAGVFWIAGAFVEPDLRVGVWGVALLIEYLGPAFSFWTPKLGRTPTADWNVEGGHMAERCGLFIIICLGESVLLTGATFAEGAWDGPAVGAFASSLLASILMWWIYFNAHAAAAADTIEHSDDPGRLARNGYTYAHIPIVAGVIVTAAGDELSLAHPLGHLEPAAVWLILGGPALFLAGSLWFKQAVFRTLSVSRGAGIALLGLAVPLVPYLTPLGLSAVATAVLAIVAVWETIQAPRPEKVAELAASKG